jgi:hypothetical protein
MFINNSQKFADWFNEKYPGAPRQITAIDAESLKACQLIHRYGFYSTSDDGKTVMGILRYMQMMEQTPTQEDYDKGEPRRCRMCGHPLPIEPEDKIGRPKEYCLDCESFRNKERKRKSRHRHKSTTTRQSST